MIIGIDPRVDYAFKKLFGSEANKTLLICLLNAVLKLPQGRQIDSVEILNPFNDKDNSDDKLTILDIKARDQLGRQYNIEMQMVAGTDFLPRILYYWCRLHGGQLSAGEGFLALRETISICFVNNVLFADVSEFHQEFKLRSSTDPKVIFTDQISIHLFELAKFTKRADELTDPVDGWCYFLVNGSTLDTDNLPQAMQVPEFDQAMEVMKMLTQDEIEWWRYEERFRAQLEANTRAQLRAMDEAREKRAQQAQKEREQVEKEREQAQKEREQVEKEREQAQKEREQKEREQVEKEREQAQREREQVEKEREQAQKEREQVEKEREQAQREREQVEKEREQAQKEREQVEKEREQAQKEREQVEKEREQAQKEREQAEKELEEARQTIQKGLADRIRFCQKLLKIPTSPLDEMLALDAAELETRARSLERQLGVELT